MAQKRQSLTGVVPNFATTMVLTLTPTGIYTWTVQQVTIRCPTAPLGSTCDIKVNGAPITPMLAAYDVAAQDPYVELHPGDRLTAEWAGLTNGANCSATFIYDDGMK